MTTPLEKLIENGGWRPIEEASSDELRKQMYVRLPRENGKYDVTTAIFIGKHELRAEDWNWENEDYVDRDDETGVEYVPEGWFEQIESDCSDYGWFGLSSKRQPTHYMPLDTPERMAREIVVAYKALKFLASAEGGSHEIAETALLVMERIAGETSCK